MIRQLAAAISIAATFSLRALSQSYTCETFSLPSNSYHPIVGLNTSGILVGNAPSQGFMRDAKGSITQLQFPGAVSTSAGGINSCGDISGSYVDKDGKYHTYIRLADGTYKPVPSALSPIEDFGQHPWVGGINDHREIAAGTGGEESTTYVQDDAGNFIYSNNGGAYVYAPEPGPLMNDLSMLYGNPAMYYATSVLMTPTGGATKVGFALPGVNIPSYGPRSEVWGLNNLGTIVGYWDGISSLHVHSGPEFPFVHPANTGHYPAIVCPGHETDGLSKNITDPFAINDDGVIAGTIQAAEGLLAFIATPTGTAPSVELSNESWDFGSQPGVDYLETGGYEGTIYVRNSGNGPLHILNLHAYPYANFTLGTDDDPRTDQFSVSKTTCSSPVPAGGWCSISIHWTPRSPLGVKDQIFFLASDAPDSPRLIHVRGTVVENDLQFSNLSWTFSPHPVGEQSGIGTIYLYASGGGSIRFSSISITGPNAADFTIAANTCGNTLAGYSTCAVSFHFKPGGKGQRRGVLSFSDDAPGSPNQVSLSGMGY
jgi:hypothetical protein